MSANKDVLRLQLQIEHLQDMIAEQNRMSLTQIELTESDRREVLELVMGTKELLTSIASNSSTRALYETSRDSYDTILQELKKLSYNVSSIEVGEPQSESDSTSKNKEPQVESYEVSVTESNYNDNEVETQSKSVKHVRFVDDSTTPLNQLYDQNEELLNHQDRRLEMISQSVTRQHVIGEGIYSELDMHNNLLEDLDNQVDTSTLLLNRAANGVRSFNRKSRDYGVCSIIMLLVLVLLILLII